MISLGELEKEVARRVARKRNLRTAVAIRFIITRYGTGGFILMFFPARLFRVGQARIHTECLNTQRPNKPILKHN